VPAHPVVIGTQSAAALGGRSLSKCDCAGSGRTAGAVTLLQSGLLLPELLPVGTISGRKDQFAFAGTELRGLASAHAPDAMLLAAPVVHGALLNEESRIGAARKPKAPRTLGARSRRAR